jgi:NAD(P)-dependent dehydrogenase (short-subunit alcohol dehydrogenase family)
MNRLDGRVAVVTGGGAGIGRGIAELFAQEGATVAVFDKDGEGAEESARILVDAGGIGSGFAVDVSSEARVEEAMREVQERYGPVSVLVNNAGFAGVDKRTHEITEQEWDAVFAVDVKGVFFCTKHAVRQMLESDGGSIVNISSIYALVGSHELTPYHAAKGAVAVMTKQDAISYARDRIRVNSVHPGTVVTDSVRELAGRSPGGLPAYEAMIIAKHPVGYLGEPIDIAYAALYLASDEARFTTGANLYVDGGYTSV